MLFNVPHKANGTLDEDTKHILLEIAAWLKVNGESLYNTRPWTTPGPGNIRFTCTPDSVFAMLLDWLVDGRTEIREPGKNDCVGQIKDVALLGYEEELRWG